VPLLKKNENPKKRELGLAPMEGVTCLATRLWFSLTSQPDFAMTPFLRVTRDYPWKRVPSTYAAEIFDLKGLTSYRLIPQLMGTSPSDLERIATPLLKNSNFVDINCGCPSPKVVGSHAGSGLLEKLEVFEEFLTGIQEKLGESRYSIKMRSGFHTNDEFPKLLKLVAKMKMSQLTLHARTRQERYTSFSKWNLIDMASQTCDFPVVGSGDIVDSQSLENTMGQAPLVEKIIVGRGALRNPWIFQELRTNENVQLTSRTLVLSLACYAVLQDILANNPSLLLQLVEKGLFEKTCGTDENLWEQLYHKLTVLYYGHYIETKSLVVERPSFARVKMIWNSLRSSLNSGFMDPFLLRVNCFPDFEKGIVSKVQESNELLSLKYSSQYDWIYSGAKNNGNEQN